MTSAFPKAYADMAARAEAAQRRMFAAEALHATLYQAVKAYMNAASSGHDGWEDDGHKCIKDLVAAMAAEPVARDVVLCDAVRVLNTAGGSRGLYLEIERSKDDWGWTAGVDPKPYKSLRELLIAMAKEYGE